MEFKNQLKTMRGRNKITDQWFDDINHALFNAAKIMQFQHEDLENFYIQSDIVNRYQIVPKKDSKKKSEGVIYYSFTDHEIKARFVNSGDKIITQRKVPSLIFKQHEIHILFCDIENNFTVKSEGKILSVPGYEVME